ncbi:hypothetical protein FH972_022751 [Carpinus fangiana]|uniref:Uncharacterized protein n=1 Tax=Carpinus fangiana TaxID=176857 RepID=A0A5N6KTQ2_9ROSI|nr:hypothetical protein FH972_022751 [Carpinus fangiana]
MGVASRWGTGGRASNKPRLRSASCRVERGQCTGRLEWLAIMAVGAQAKAEAVESDRWGRGRAEAGSSWNQARARVGRLAVRRRRRRCVETLAAQQQGGGVSRQERRHGAGPPVAAQCGETHAILQEGAGPPKQSRGGFCCCVQQGTRGEGEGGDSRQGWRCGYEGPGVPPRGSGKPMSSLAALGASLRHTGREGEGLQAPAASGPDSADLSSLLSAKHAPASPSEAVPSFAGAGWGTILAPPTTEQAVVAATTTAAMLRPDIPAAEALPLPAPPLLVSGPVRNMVRPAAESLARPVPLPRLPCVECISLDELSASLSCAHSLRQQAAAAADAATCPAVVLHPHRQCAQGQISLACAPPRRPLLPHQSAPRRCLSAGLKSSATAAPTLRAQQSGSRVPACSRIINTLEASPSCHDRRPPLAPAVAPPLAKISLGAARPQILSQFFPALRPITALLEHRFCAGVLQYQGTAPEAARRRRQRLYPGSFRAPALVRPAASKLCTAHGPLQARVKEQVVSAAPSIAFKRGVHMYASRSALPPHRAKLSLPKLHCRMSQTNNAVTAKGLVAWTVKRSSSRQSRRSDGRSLAWIDDDLALQPVP